MYDAESINVAGFMEKFNVDQPFPMTPQLLKPEAICRRMNHIEEEYNELADAVVRQDLPAIADALVDLVYVIKGTALAMGLPWEMLWVDVQRANMAKVYKPADPKIAVKPAGWEGPKTETILEIAGWKRPAGTPPQGGALQLDLLRRVTPAPEAK